MSVCLGGGGEGGEPAFFIACLPHSGKQPHERTHILSPSSSLSLSRSLSLSLSPSLCRSCFFSHPTPLSLSPCGALLRARALFPPFRSYLSHTNVDTLTIVCVRKRTHTHKLSHLCADRQERARERERQKRPTIEAKETYYRGKRDLL